MKKFVCTICGYVYEGEAAPEKYKMFSKKNVSRLYIS